MSRDKVKQPEDRALFYLSHKETSGFQGHWKQKTFPLRFWQAWDAGDGEGIDFLNIKIFPHLQLWLNPFTVRVTRVGREVKSRLDAGNQATESTTQTLS